MYSRKRGRSSSFNAADAASGRKYRRTFHRIGRRRFVRRTMGPLATSPERKYFDSYKVQTSITASTNWTGTEVDPATANCLFSPTLGDDITNREGRRAAVLSLKIHGSVYWDRGAIGAGLENGHVRVVVYMDKQTNGVQAQGEEVFESPAANNTVSPFGFMNKANFGRFKVLKDLVVRKPNTSAWAAGFQDAIEVPFKIHIKFRKALRVHFNDTNGGSVADITDHSFHIVAISRHTTPNMENPTISYVARTTFVDF